MYHVLEASEPQGAPLETTAGDLGYPKEAPGPLEGDFNAVTDSLLYTVF